MESFGTIINGKMPNLGTPGRQSFRALIMMLLAYRHSYGGQNLGARLEGYCKQACMEITAACRFGNWVKIEKNIVLGGSMSTLHVLAPVID